MSRRAFLATLAFTLSACGSRTPSGAAARTLVLGVQATKPDDTRAAWQPLVDDLARQLGQPMALHVGSQTDVVQALAQRRVDLAWLSSSAAIDAVVDADARAMALYVNALWAKQVDLCINNTTDLAVFQARTPGARDGLRTL